MDILKSTPLEVIYNKFISKITEDLYAELTEEDTCRDAEGIFENAIPNFEFPRFPSFNYELLDYVDTSGARKRGYYSFILTREEIDIIADLMMIEWLSRQIASIENTRMKYSGSDFKFTSQANHLDKLIKTLTKFQSGSLHKQRLYKRRKISEETGTITPNYGGLAGGALSNESR